MPQITTIRVVRRRSVQPEQYGSAAAEVELVGNVLEGEDYRKVARQMLNDSRTLVYENLGMKLPAKALEATAEVDTPTETAKVEVEKTETKEEEPKRKGPGRPKGSKNKPKKEEEKKQEADDDGIPDDGAPQIRTNPEDRRNPEDDDDGIPDDDTPATKPTSPNSSAADIPDDDDDSSEEQEEQGSSDDDGFTTEDLHQMTNEAVKAGNLSVQNAKQVLAEMGIARWRDLPAEKVGEAKQRLEKAIETSSK